VTWNPYVDEQLDDCPCLQLVQCLVREGRLSMKVVFRSNDMLSAAGANMFAWFISRTILQIISDFNAAPTPTSPLYPMYTISVM